jgi:hypothetical protein
MLTGGPDRPFPRDCPQDCHLGPQYAQWQGGTVPLYTNITTVPNPENQPCSPPGSTVTYTIAPSSQNALCDLGCADTGGVVRPYTILGGTDCDGPITDPLPAPGTPPGGWIGAAVGSSYKYTLAAGSNSVPAQPFAEVMTVAVVTIAAGGTGYVVGDSPALVLGTAQTACPGGIAGFTVTTVSGEGAITGIAITTGGQYVSGLTPPTTCALTAGSGTGASLNLNFARATQPVSQCQNTGFKNLATCRQWHGAFGWTSHDPGGCDSTYCVTAVADTYGNAPGAPGYVPTWTTTSYEPYQPDADQTKYLTCDTECSLTVVTSNFTAGAFYNYQSNATGAVSVDATTGEITNGVITSEDFYAGDDSDPMPGTHIRHVSGGAGYTAENDDGTVVTTDFLSGMSTLIDGVVSQDVHCTASIIAAFYNSGVDDPSLDAMPAQWNAAAGFINNNPDLDLGTYTYFPSVTDPNNYGPSTVTGVVDEGDGYTYTQTLTISWSRTATTFTWSIVQTIVNTEPDAEQSSYSYTGTLTLSNPNYASDIYADAVYLSSLVPLDDDGLYGWRTDTLQQVAPLVSRNEVPSNVSPVTGFLPATQNQMDSPIADPAGNGVWETNVSPATAPYVYNADAPGTWSPTYTQIPWTDPAAWQWPYGCTSANAGDTTNTIASGPQVHMVDGSILGQFESAGYQNNFSFQFEIWKGCYYNNDYGCGLDWLYQNYGSWLTDFNAASGAQLPLNCTQWTNSYEVIDKPPGACVMYASDIVNDAFCNNAVSERNGALWLYKFAVIAEKWQSQNYARPGGNDRFLIDETQVYCVASGSGTSFVVTDLAGDTLTGAIPGIGTGLWGGPAVGGWWSGCGCDDSGNVTLGTLALHVPAGWDSPSKDGATVFAPLRFPTCPSLLGRVAVTTAPPISRVITFTWQDAQPQFGMAPSGTESVTIYDRGMNVLGTETATRTADGTFTVTTSTDYSTAVWVMIAGSPAWYFNSNYPRGNFLTLEWLEDTRTNGQAGDHAETRDCAEQANYDAWVAGGSVGDEPSDALPPPADTPTLAWPPGGPYTSVNSGFASFTQTQHCLPDITCAPRVICFTPNGETFANGVTVAMPDTFTMDERYGSYWYGKVQTTMTEMFYQQPHVPCGTDPTDWVQDDGSCNLAGDPPATYGCPPLAEAEAQFPGYGISGTESPSAWFPYTPGWLSPVDYATGDVAYPDAPMGFDANGNPSGFTSEYLHRATLIANIGCFNYSDWVLP